MQRSKLFKSLASNKNMDVKSRKKIIKELSFEYHPDKIQAQGCPQAFGHPALTILNSYRAYL